MKIMIVHTLALCRGKLLYIKVVYKAIIFKNVLKRNYMLEMCQ